MKLISEVTESVKYIVEAKEDGGKNYFLSGIFLQTEKYNRNQRMYPMPVMEREVQRYQKEYIDTKRAFGELGHPDTPSINLDRVSHMIVDLHREGTDFVGKAKVMDTPYGKIVKNFMDEGASLGVSSRGLGSLVPTKEGGNIVQDDYHLATAADIVADPSAHDAWVQAVYEGKEWIWDNGIIREAEIASMKKELLKTSKKDLEATQLRLFEKFLRKL
jgi:hypothetical protein